MSSRSLRKALQAGAPLPTGPSVPAVFAPPVGQSHAPSVRGTGNLEDEEGALDSASTAWNIRDREVHSLSPAQRYFLSHGVGHTSLARGGEVPGTVKSDQLRVLPYGSVFISLVLGCWVGFSTRRPEIQEHDIEVKGMKAIVSFEFSSI